MTGRTTADEFDRRFAAGEDISEFVDWDTPVDVPVIPRPEPVFIQVELSLPEVMKLDEMAREHGMSRSDYVRSKALEREPVSA